MILTDEASLLLPCSDITDLDGEGMELLDRLHQELIVSLIQGVGLAANQIGIHKRAFVLQIPEKDGTFAYSFINPKIEKLEGPVSFLEGCLSYPQQQVRTLRYRKCRVVDSLAPGGRDFEGLTAIAAQHETAHTNSLTMYDQRLENFKPDSDCPCASGKKFGQCCQPKIKPFHT